MLNGRIVEQVYLAAGPTDLRKSIDGLAVIVQKLFQLDPFTNALFVFCNRKKDKLKILFWDHNGFWLYYRRLKKGLFDWPDPGSSQPLPITSRQLNWLLDGLPLYRQENQLERLGILLNRQTLSNWLISSTTRWLSPFYDHLHRQLLQENLLHADETSLQVLDEPGKTAQSKSYPSRICGSNARVL